MYKIRNIRKICKTQFAKQNLHKTILWAYFDMILISPHPLTTTSIPLEHAYPRLRIPGVDEGISCK
jgi:hypothetical protein